MVKPPIQQDVTDEEVARLRDAVLKWVDAKKATEAKPADRPVAKKTASKKEATVTKPATIPKVTIPRQAGKGRKASMLSVLRIIVAIAIVVLFFALITVFGMLFMHWDNAVVRFISRYVPVPAAIVDANVVPYYTWVTQTQSLKVYYSRNATSEQPIPSESQIKQYVLNRLIEQQLVKALAKRYTVSVSPEELDKQIKSLAEEVGSYELLEEQINDLYGWSIDEFRKSVVEPLLLRNKLGLALTLDDRLNYNARVRADELLEKIRKGEDSFEHIASRYSQDVSAIQGGDLGYFKPEDMVPEFNQAVLALEPGQVSGVVKTRFGYHIIKLVEVLKNDDASETQVRAKHILIRSKGLDEYIDQAREQSYIARLVVIK